MAYDLEAFLADVQRAVAEPCSDVSDSDSLRRADRWHGSVAAETDQADGDLLLDVPVEPVTLQCLQAESNGRRIRRELMEDGGLHDSAFCSLWWWLLQGEMRACIYADICTHVVVCLCVCTYVCTCL